MDNNDYGFDRTAFDAVWQRVLGASDEKPSNTSDKPSKPPRRTDAAQQLRELMDGASTDAVMYTALSARVSGCCRRTLLCIAGDKKRHLKKLRAQYFLLTGCTYTPPPCCPLIYCVTDVLRQKYLGELDGSASHRNAAEEASDKELSELYQSISEDKASHARLICGVLENLL